MQNTVTTIRPGIRFLSKAGAFAMYDNKTGTVAFTGEYATSYQMAITSTKNQTRGGSGNALLFQTFSDRNVEITLTIKDFNLEYIAAAEGGVIDYLAGDKYAIERPFSADADGKVTLDPLPTNQISVRLPDNTRINVSADASGVIDLSAYGIASECINATYAYNGTGKQTTITADKAPYIGHLVLQGDIFDSKVGKVGMVEVDIESFQLSDNITLAFNSDGTTSDTTITGVALAIAGSQNCGEGLFYGVVKEFIFDSIAPKIAEVIASPSPIELSVASGDTETLSVTASMGPMYATVALDNTEVTFASGDTSVAAVNAAGVVTPVAAGSTTVSAAYNGISDEVEVTVVA